MNENRENQQSSETEYFFNENKLDQDELFVEIPSVQKLTDYDRVPTSFEPMGEIYLRGRIFRRIASGKTKCWILISSWIIFGIPAFLF